MGDLGLKSGLTASEIESIQKFMQKYTEIEEASVFGSRALGSYKEASDVDLALFGDGVSAKTAENLKFDIEEESYLPYFFDVISYNDITVPSLKEHIDRYGEVIYRKGWREVLFDKFIEFDPKISFKKGILLKKVTMDSLKPFTKRIQGFTKETEFIVLRAIESVSDSQFIYYLAISSDFRDTAIQLMSGTSGRQRVELNALKKKTYMLPPLPEQKAIASVLSSLDDKIDLLNRQNKTLEDLAQNFRQWFIEEAGEDLFQPIFNKIYNNTTQIRTLTALRDTLLPKLISGEVRVRM